MPIVRTPWPRLVMFGLVLSAPSASDPATCQSAGCRLRSWRDRRRWQSGRIAKRRRFGTGEEQNRILSTRESSSVEDIMTRRIWVSVTTVLTLLASPLAVRAHAQAAATAPAAASTLTLDGDVTTPLTLSPADLKSMPRAVAETQDEGRTVKYEGVLVAELLKRAGLPLGNDLRGNAVATYVLASASDGYQVVFSLAELDPGFTGSEIIVADSVDGKPLFAYQGAFRIVAPKDKRGARSIRMLERLQVVRLKK